MNLVRAVVRLIDRLNGLVGYVAAISLLGLIALVCYEVFLRYVMKAPTTWGNEMISFIFAAYVMLGGGYTLLHRDHVSMDIIYSRFSMRGRAIIDVGTAFFMLLFCWVLFEQTFIMAKEALETGQRASSDWSPPLFPVMVSLPIGAGLLLLQAIARIARDLHLALTNSPLLPEDVVLDAQEVRQ
ncbi:TRAP transporter small permease subunit [Hyphomicrobium sp. CS1BSMeth3]|jgi:TRAP-type mannitol/chloroaromatic compound transport system permease small subunit|uniref:TRAP transporter small permease subunit n=1 Tax=Hyphomicrobium sp. CS1BSMeth3 TaxID=1892844 RepID=UPI000931D84A|nr:TRAP transporter small permease subunit [Hyphomicrobium sp. CS1BSMeth3]